jgi:hypothetical protein
MTRKVEASFERHSPLALDRRKIAPRHAPPRCTPEERTSGAVDFETGLETADGPAWILQPADDAIDLRLFKQRALIDRPHPDIPGNDRFLARSSSQTLRT